MGTLAKRLGQLAARSLESESSNILKSGAANKRGLSAQLDATLRASHDMKVFGLGTAASMASRPRYARFTHSMHAIYQAMEHGLDSTDSEPVRHVWKQFGAPLRRSAALAADLEEVFPNFPGAPPSIATRAYVEAIGDAARADSQGGGARLLGHFYCRYFAGACLLPRL